MTSGKQDATRDARPRATTTPGWTTALWRRSGILCLLLSVTAIALSAQTFTTLHSFDSTDGFAPYVRLVQATDGSLYGTTPDDGANGYGTVFKITPSGTLTTAYNACSQTGCTDGEYPSALIQATDGNFYGTMGAGGANGYGTVFKITPSGTLTTLHSFDDTDGSGPNGLVQATDGNFYGTTGGGGANGQGGTVFEVIPSGALTTLYSFCSQSGCTDGAVPLGGLIQALDGNFYGTTLGGGANFGTGTVFKITSRGVLTTLYNFCSITECACIDGSYPEAGLVQGTDGNFYGTTANGGASGDYGNYGSVFKITPSGTLTTLYSFFGTDGAYPAAGLVQATDGNFYGTTPFGGANQSSCGGSGCGTAFKITSGGTLTTLHSFDGTDGEFPSAALAQDTNGSFYGTTSGGGTSGACDYNGNPGCGTVFGLSVGLRPFVETLPTSGKVGALVKILGTNLTGATGVSFNGVAAVYKVVSNSLISAVVPMDATTGTVQVVTPSGTLSSNVQFRVR